MFGKIRLKWVKDSFDEDVGIEKQNKLLLLISLYVSCLPRMIGSSTDLFLCED